MLDKVILFVLINTCVAAINKTDNTNLQRLKRESQLRGIPHKKGIGLNRTSNRTFCGGAKDGKGVCNGETQLLSSVRII
jgi:hypothetical protein